MTTSKWLGLAVLVFASWVSNASDKLGQPVGYFIDPITESADSPAGRHAKFIRDGKEFDAIEGEPVFIGDVVVTDATGGMQIAFMDNSAIRLLESTEFRIDPPAKTETASQPAMTLSYGHASFIAAPVARDLTANFLNTGVGDGAANLINLGIGSHATISPACMAKIDLLVTRNPDGTTYTTNVAVLKGSATLAPGTNGKVNLTYLSIAVLTINTAVAGFNGSQMTLNQGNLSVSQITALAAKSVSATSVCVNTNGTVTINTAKDNADGSVSVGKITEVLGHLTKDTWTTKDANNRVVATWSESKYSIILSRLFDGYTLKSNVGKKNDTGSGTLKGPNGTTYKGTTTYDPTSGSIVFTSQPSRDGSSVVYKYNPAGPNGGENDLITISKTGVATLTSVSYNPTTGIQTTTTEQGTYVNGQFVGDPNTLVSNSKNIGTTANSGTTPDGHSIDQNSPPITQ